jgi:ABC-2 type transport system ATP-binding protein
MGIAIEVRDLVVERGKRRVLHGITSTISAGSVTGLLGPSGSGKTTLIRAIVGVQIVRSGTVTVLGRPAGHPANRPTVGYVTQAPSVYADLTVRENARYFAALHDCELGRPTRRSRTSDWPARRPSWSATSPAGSGAGPPWPAR